MRPVIVVDADAMDLERRKAMYAYAASFIAQGIAGFMGWHLHAMWPQIIGRFS